MRVWTIGHSAQPLDELVALLRQHAIGLVADVRRFPASRRHPQFAREALAASLKSASIGYEWLPELGGRRPARAASRNLGWPDDAFRGYADYMETEPFQLGIARLAEVAAARRTAVLCAEGDWRQCHRGLISDFLRAGGHEVQHILRDGALEPHPWTAPAKLIDGELRYPAADPVQRSLRF